jgi:hypothetical protein
MGDGDEATETEPPATRGPIEGSLRRLFASKDTYLLTRFALLRLLGVVYLVAFVVIVVQWRPLLGHGGLMPADAFVDRCARSFESRGACFWRAPSIFWLVHPADNVVIALAWVGVVLSTAVVLGATNALVQLALWALYLSFVHVGQTFYGYGWETQLCETGFLAVFLCPVRSIGPLPRAPPSRVVVVLFRWLVVRVMLGAGLIKLRGDPCWRDLTCLVYHYETQPNPNPLAWLLHQAPPWFHALGVLVNHAVELVAPLFAFGPRRARRVAGCAMIAFQLVLIASGNLSFLNWLTIVPAIACLDDDLLARALPRRLVDHAREVAAAAVETTPQRYAAITLAVVVGFLSVGPIDNLLSSHQAMNRGFEPFDLVNTYGAFGSVGRVRHEVILEGTRDREVTASTKWLEYELPCEPGDVTRRPCVVTPYHLRLDWQMWFAGFSTPEQEPWVVELAAKLLAGDRPVRGLFAVDPFPDQPPRFVRAELYRYEFTRIGDGSHAWWRRARVGPYLPPLSLGDPTTRAFLEDAGLTPP